MHNRIRDVINDTRSKIPFHSACDGASSNIFWGRKMIALENIPSEKEDLVEKS
jgi:hypothetical protein